MAVVAKAVEVAAAGGARLEALARQRSATSPALNLVAGRGGVEIANRYVFLLVRKCVRPLPFPNQRHNHKQINYAYNLMLSTEMVTYRCGAHGYALPSVGPPALPPARPSMYAMKPSLTSCYLAAPSACCAKPCPSYASFASARSRRHLEAVSGLSASPGPGSCCSLSVPFAPLPVTPLLATPVVFLLALVA